MLEITCYSICSEHVCSALHFAWFHHHILLRVHAGAQQLGCRPSCEFNLSEKWSHGSFVNKAPSVSFPFVQENKTVTSRETVAKELYKWMFLYTINCLHFKAYRGKAIIHLVLSCGWRRMPDIWDSEQWERVLGGNYTNHFDDRLWLGHFRWTKTTFKVLCSEIGILVSPVMPTNVYSSHRKMQIMCMSSY